MKVHPVPSRFNSDPRIRDGGDTGKALEESSRFIDVILDAHNAEEFRSTPIISSQRFGSKGPANEYFGLIRSPAKTL